MGAGTPGRSTCTRLRRLDARYRKKYGMSMIENLGAIREQGIRAFVRTERERWTCTACGGAIDVHHGRCSACRKERESEEVGSLVSLNNRVGVVHRDRGIRRERNPGNVFWD